VTHEQAGAEWTAEGVRGVCSCGWKTEAVPVGPGWIDELYAQYAQHLVDVGA